MKAKLIRQSAMQLPDTYLLVIYSPKKINEPLVPAERRDFVSGNGERESLQMIYKTEPNPTPLLRRNNEGKRIEMDHRKRAFRNSNASMSLLTRLKYEKLR